LAETPTNHSVVRISARPAQAHFRSARFLVHALWAILLLVLFSYPSSLVSTRAQSSPGEYQLKAAFIFHFAQLVDWPADALGPENRPISLCTAGEDTPPGVLEATVQGKQIGSHPLEVRRLRERDSPLGCHILFLAGRDKKRTVAILDSVNDAPILTVGESEGFAQQGGMIGFCLQENKVRFDVNLKAAQRANLRISSRLLLLAKSVIGGGKQE
jgi:YfiR/HmsC-like